jgi:hypothetical protein
MEPPSKSQPITSQFPDSHRTPRADSFPSRGPRNQHTEPFQCSSSHANSTNPSSSAMTSKSPSPKYRATGFDSPSKPPITSSSCGPRSPNAWGASSTSLHHQLPVEASTSPPALPKRRLVDSNHIAAARPLHHRTSRIDDWMAQADMAKLRCTPASRTQNLYQRHPRQHSDEDQHTTGNADLEHCPQVVVVGIAHLNTQNADTG